MTLNDRPSRAVLAVLLSASVFDGLTNAEEFAFTTPAILDEQLQPLEAAAVKSISEADGTVGLLTAVGGDGAVGLALDTEGGFYFGVATSSFPYQVQLNRRSADGTVTPVATVLDSTGGLISIVGQSFDLAVGVDGKVYFTTPQILAGEDGTEGVLAPAAVRRIDPKTAEIETVFELDSAGAVGLAFDASGSLYVGSIVSQSPLIIDIVRRTDEGDVTTVGTALDSTDGVILLNGQSFDLAVGLDGLVYFTLPTVFDAAEPLPGEPSGVLSASSVSRIDPESGQSEVVVSDVAVNAAGVTFGQFGELYYGAVTSAAPLIIDLRRATVGGEEIETIGTALDTSAGLISFLGQSFDLAALPHTVLLQLVNENACRPDCFPIGGDGVVSVQDLVTVLEAWGTPYYGADVDSSGLVDIQDLLAVVLAWGECR